ncbi:MAG: 1-deoxy-D-xylulose-5-phosphate reductoisomerase [Paludibacteraceae bacterium]|nr:1-deoxy-D-xylulose-5-phosphate reductoisomerase [Paludibacteraceae bacterium]
MKQLAILGSTGSIGTQTLDVVREQVAKAKANGLDEAPFGVYALVANRSVDLLVKQAVEFRPEVVCIADESLYDQLRNQLRDALGEHAFGLMKVWAGDDAIADMVTLPSIDVVVASMVGYAGLRPTISAIRAGKTIALANKETLVVAGELICGLAHQYHASILPVDSEHSAIFQSLAGEEKNEIEKILLTCSGGPFRKWTKEQIANATAADALKHPNWDMGAKITIDSASLMNKGFEVIEAKWLFGVDVDQIEVLVHPESIVHSGVQFRDGGVKAQLGAPDMRLPIQYALTYPQRLIADFPRLNLFEVGQLTFEKPDLERFPNLGLAYEAMRRGGTVPCVLNAANEVVNLAFRQGKIGFWQMSEVMAKVMDAMPYIAKPTYEDYVCCDQQTRIMTEGLI